MTAGATDPMRLGVFGGAFDPPHAAHRALVQAALDQLQLDQLRVIPTGQAWHKARVLSPAPDRLAMARLAFADLSRVVVDPCETLRSGPSYTIDTLRDLKAADAGAELYLIVGQDQALALPGWREWQEVVRLAIICVAARPDLTGSMRPFMAPVGLGLRCRQLSFPHLPVSATDIRQRIGRGQGVVPLVCNAVARYIADHHLYLPAR